MGKYIDCHNCQEHYDCERTYLGGCFDGKEFEEEKNETPFAAKQTKSRVGEEKSPTETAEKKLTDEDIAQALLQNIEYGKAITYFDKWGNHNSIMIADIIDFIHRLQSEKEELHEKRMDAEYAIDKWMKENAEQKAEIERLTEENRTIVSISNGFALERNNLRDEVNELRKEKRHLQKKVDELNLELLRYKGLKIEIEKASYEQGQFDTAKEILEKAPTETNADEMFIHWLRERFGVEVE